MPGWNVGKSKLWTLNRGSDGMRCPASNNAGAKTSKTANPLDAKTSGQNRYCS